MVQRQVTGYFEDELGATMSGQNLMAVISAGSVTIPGIRESVVEAGRLPVNFGWYHVV